MNSFSASLTQDVLGLLHVHQTFSLMTIQLNISTVKFCYILRTIKTSVCYRYLCQSVSWKTPHLLREADICNFSTLKTQKQTGPNQLEAIKLLSPTPWYFLWRYKGKPDFLNIFYFIPVDVKPSSLHYFTDCWKKNKTCCYASCLMGHKTSLYYVHHN